MKESLVAFQNYYLSVISIIKSLKYINYPRYPYLCYLIAANIGPRNSGAGGKKQGYGTGRQTLRFQKNGQAKVEEVDDTRTLAEEKINQLLENFLGINDADLGKLPTS